MIDRSVFLAEVTAAARAAGDAAAVLARAIRDLREVEHRANAATSVHTTLLIAYQALYVDLDRPDPTTLPPLELIPADVPTLGRLYKLARSASYEREDEGLTRPIDE